MSDHAGHGPVANRSHPNRPPIPADTRPHDDGGPRGAPRDPAVGHGYIADKEQIVARLRRIEGQVRGLQRMVDDDAYCIDILTQVSATTRALHAVATGLLDDHLAHCVRDAIRTGDEQEIATKLSEASGAIDRLVRS